MSQGHPVNGFVGAIPGVRAQIGAAVRWAHSLADGLPVTPQCAFHRRSPR